MMRDRPIALTLLSEQQAKASRPPIYCYVGTDSDARERITAALTHSTEVDLLDDVRRAEGELRAPFLALIAEVGRLQRDRRAWHGTTLAWRDPEADSTFLACCQVWAACRQLEGLVPRQPMAIVAPDPWVRITLARRLSLAEPRIPRTLLAARLFRGIAARSVWAWRAWREARAMRRAMSGAYPSGGVLLYSLYHPRCLVPPNDWRDPFFGNLDRLLEARSTTVLRLLPIGSNAPADDVASRARYLLPQAAFASLGAVLRAATARWTPIWPRDARLDGIDVTPLLEAAWWRDVGRAVWCHSALFHSTLREIFARCRLRGFVWPFENQPWERMAVLAAREASVRTVGYQHSTVPRLSLNYFLAPGQHADEPLPDVVVTAGRIQRDLLAGGGIPSRQVRIGGSLRYPSFSAQAARERRAPEAGGRKRILVATAHHIGIARELDAALHTAFPDGGVADGIEFGWRPHPTLLDSDPRIGSWMGRVNGELAPQFDSFDAAITVGTTVALEARLLGIPVIRFRSATSTDLDPSDALPQWMIPVFDGRNAREAVLALFRTELHDQEDDLRRWRGALFAPVDMDVWTHVLDPDSSPCVPA